MKDVERFYANYAVGICGAKGVSSGEFKKVLLAHLFKIFSLTFQERNSKNIGEDFSSDNYRQS
jgi:hypothetical protein